MSTFGSAPAAQNTSELNQLYDVEMAVYKWSSYVSSSKINDQYGWKNYNKGHVNHGLIPFKISEEFIDCVLPDIIQNESAHFLTMSKKLMEDRNNIESFLNDEDEDDDDDDDDVNMSPPPTQQHQQEEIDLDEESDTLWRKTANWFNMMRFGSQFHGIQYCSLASPRAVVRWCCEDIAFSDAVIIAQEWTAFIEYSINRLNEKANKMQRKLQNVDVIELEQEKKITGKIKKWRRDARKMKKAVNNFNNR